MDKKKLISNLSGITSNVQTQINGKANSSHTHTSANISDLQGKLDGKANSSHTHTKSQISDFPSSLPANGGNADTVDGKHASDFRPSNWMPTADNVGALAKNVVNNNVKLGQYINIYDYDDNGSNDTSAKLYLRDGQINASFKDLIISGTYVVKSINDLKSSVSNGKNAIASAITGKGVSASGSEDFASLANKIKQIPTANTYTPVGSGTTGFTPPPSQYLGNSEGGKITSTACLILLMGSSFQDSVGDVLSSKEFYYANGSGWRKSTSCQGPGRTDNVYIFNPDRNVIEFLNIASINICIQ